MRLDNYNKSMFVDLKNTSGSLSQVKRHINILKMCDPTCFDYLRVNYVMVGVQARDIYNRELFRHYDTCRFE